MGNSLPVTVIESEDVSLAIYRSQSAGVSDAASIAVTGKLYIQRFVVTDQQKIHHKELLQLLVYAKDCAAAGAARSW